MPSSLIASFGVSLVLLATSYMPLSAALHDRIVSGRPTVRASALPPLMPNDAITECVYQFTSEPYMQGTPEIPEEVLESLVWFCAELERIMREKGIGP